MVMIAMLSVGFASCSDDDDDSEKSEIVGTWAGSTTYNDGSSESFIWIFKADGNFSAKFWDDDPSDFGHVSGTYNYDAELSILTVSGVDEEGDYFSDYCGCKISGNKMYLTTSDGNIVLTRQK